MDKTTSTETAQKDIKHATELVKWILDTVGAWPVPGTSSFSRKFAQKIKNFISYFLILLILLPCLARIFLKEKETKVRLKMMAVMVNAGMQFSKYTLLLYHEKKIIHGLNLIKEDWMSATSKNRLIFLEKTEIGRTIVLIAASTIYSGGLGYRIFLPLAKGTIVTPDNTTIRPLPCPTYLVFMDEQQTPLYEILFVLQIMAGFVTYTVVAGSCGICALMVLHACSLQRILINKMRDLVKGAETSEAAIVHHKIADIVDYQTKINDFVKYIQGITEYICLIEMLGGTCLICLLEYYVLLEWENKNTTGVVVYFILLTSFIFSIFVLCNIGQLLVDEGNDASKTSSTLEFYRIQVKQAQSLILVNVMSNYPMKLTAGKVMEMSLTTFTDVIKLSLGYLNMLRQVV